MTKEKKKVEKPKNSTLAIDSETSERLDFFCRKHEITKKEFVKLALDYFDRTGIDICSNDTLDNMHEINEKMDALIKLQADATIKLTGIQQATNLLMEVKEDTTKLIERKEEKKTLFGFLKKK